MANAYKCDFTGKLVEGTPIRAVDVEISDNLVIRAQLFEKHPGNRLVEGELSPEGAHVIQAALATLKRKEGDGKKR